MNRKRMNLSIEYSGLVDRIETFDKEPVFPHLTTSALIIIKALNMSPKDISFFDIQAFRRANTSASPLFL